MYNIGDKITSEAMKTYCKLYCGKCDEPKYLQECEVLNDVSTSAFKYIFGKKESTNEHK